MCRLKNKSPALISAQAPRASRLIILFVLIIIQSTESIEKVAANSHSLLFQANQAPAAGQLLPTTTPAAPTTTVAAAAEPPDFQEPIGNHTVALGKDAQLSCKINNLGNFRTAWLRVEDKGILTIHNNIITRNYRVGLLNNDNGREFVLTIRNVQPSDKGGYMCQINSIPMRYAIGHLDVLTPPVFDESSPSPSSSSSPITTTISPSSSYDQQLADQQPQQQQQQQQQASQVTVSEASNATLSCKAHGHPTPTITWRREDGQAILLNGLDHHSSDSAAELDSLGSKSIEAPSLFFSSVHRLNSGAYLCIASNGIQPSASKRIVLDVQFRPVVTLPQTELAASLNQAEARLECLVDLNPLGSYHWVKLIGDSMATQTAAATTTQTSGQEDDLWLIEHDELMQSDKYEIVIKQVTSERVQMILNIRLIEKKDFAQYKCIGRNSLGLQSNTIRLYESSPSSFSLNNMFRGGGGGGSGGPAEPQQDGGQSTSGGGTNDVQLNDQTTPTRTANGGRPQVLANQQRAQTRSSWIQRSSGSSVRQVSGSGADQHNNAAKHPVNHLILLSSLLINYSLWALVFMQQQQQQQPRSQH